MNCAPLGKPILLPESPKAGQHGWHVRSQRRLMRVFLCRDEVNSLLKIPPRRNGPSRSGNNRLQAVKEEGGRDVARSGDLNFAAAEKYEMGGKHEMGLPQCSKGAVVLRWLAENEQPLLHVDGADPKVLYSLWASQTLLELSGWVHLGVIHVGITCWQQFHVGDACVEQQWGWEKRGMTRTSSGALCISSSITVSVSYFDVWLSLEAKSSVFGYTVCYRRCNYPEIPLQCPLFHLLQEYKEDYKAKSKIGRCGELSSGVQNHCPTVQEGSVYNKWDKQDPGLSLGPSAAALMFLREKKQQMCSIPQQALDTYLEEQKVDILVSVDFNI
ncbi:hypothetical protein Anapl_08311 [Anas platyrhynchos]|uniref:Uncharacterized protein n=1 Tax=Anas platyrhynchos TaxID=8839 RepID=R0LBM7_ANAPL|nr:hypothetical protein Anapl_08311 [Anas platyrhynchos]